VGLYLCIVNVVIFGASGLLGRTLVALAPGDWHVVSPSRRECDIGDPESVHALLAEHRPAVLVNAAAFTNVDASEDQPDAARRANTVGPGCMADACREVGARMIHVSTDYVFDGRAAAPYLESAIPNPLSEYGRSKLGGERAVLGALPSALVVRTQWLFGAGARSLIPAMRDRAARGETARVVDDQAGRATYVVDLASALITFAGRADVTGLLHVANDGEATAYELAVAVYAHYGRPDLVTPVSTAEYGARAARPAYSPLALDRLRALGIQPRHWRDALAAYLASA
jgi:dTDP-4-dehydrorhamnose reductase